MARLLSRHALLFIEGQIVSKAKILAVLVMVMTVNVTAIFAEEVRVYNWSDYIADSVIKDFEQETGINVIYDVYDSNEVLEGKLLAGRTGYDVVGPSIEYLGRQIMAGVYQKLDLNQLTNHKSLDKAMMTKLSTMDPDNQYAIPYLWGTTGIGYNQDHAIEIMGDEFQMDTFDVLFDPAIISKFEKCGIAFLDAPSEAFKAALHYVGKDPNTKNPNDYKNDAFKVLKSVRPYIKYFHSSKYINDLANGDICLVFGWNGDILQAADRAQESGNGVKIIYKIPSEGAQFWFDMMAIPKDAPNTENAHTFINYILRPEVMARISNKVKFANANIDSKSMINIEITQNPSIYPPDDIMKKLFLAEIAGPKIDRIMTRQWINIKNKN